MTKSTNDRQSDHPTRLSCPDCSGVLSMKPVENHGHPIFICRVGHTYSISDLLVGKEEQVETRLWSAVVALEELVDVLNDFRRYAEEQSLPTAASALKARAERARAQAQRVREVLADNRAIEIGEEVCRLRATANV